jgi:hypothetical protein
LFSSNCESAFVSANEGISVWKRVDGFEPPYVSLVLNVPWIAVPLEVIEATWPFWISCRKNGLYGTRIRGAGWIVLLPA